jgi:hypothetical protein
MYMESLRKPQFAAGPPAEGVDVLVIVAGAESAQQHTAFVRFVIAVGVAQMQQLRAVANIRAAIAQLQTGGNHQAVGEDRGFIAAPISVGVFKNEILSFGTCPGSICG